MLAVVESEDAETLAGNMGAMAGGCKSEPLTDLRHRATARC